MAVDYGSLPFDQQVTFFRQKLNLPTAAWTDIWQAQHDRSFVVAGAVRDDLLTDLRGAVDKAIAQGTTLAEFRRDFDGLVGRHGWTYKGGRNWRTRVIYETNLRTSYMAGRYQQMQQIKRTRPYWRYKHNDGVQHPRPQHQAWDGLVLAADDPWWQTHYPPNGWGCRCYIETLSRRDLEKSGKTGADRAPPLDMRQVTVGRHGPSPRTVEVPAGIDPGWAYAPGKSWAEAMTPPPLPGGSLLPPVTGSPAADAGALPIARAAPASRLLPDNLTDRQYIDAFLAEFGLAGGDRYAIHMDVAGEPLIISDALFRERRGDLKVSKRGRAVYLLLYADTIKAPDEIWEDWADFGGRRVLRRRYLARWAVAGEDVPALAVFETGPQGWVGVTAHKTDRIADLERRGRRGTRVWHRKK